MSLSIAAIDAAEISKWIFVFFFFVLPILRSILGKKEKGSRRTGPTEEEPDDFEFEDDEDDYSGAEGWERLLRGEPPVAKVEPTTAVPRRVVDPIPVHRAVGRSAPPTLVDAREPDAAASDLGFHESVAPFSGLPSASASSANATEELSSGFASLEERTEIPVFERASGRSRRAVDWREAIRTREILGLPVALRRGAAELLGFR